MPLHRHRLPQLDARRPFLTDGGLETTLIFHHGITLPLFAACDLLRDAEGVARLRRYYAEYAALARAHDLGLVLESATWRASRDWMRRLAYSDEQRLQINLRAIDLLLEVRRDYAGPNAPMPIGGVLGPRGDGYRADCRMSADAAADYHAEQIAIFARSEADFVAAYTLTYSDEAIGITRAAAAAGMPLAVSFTLETDGRLPSGENLAEAIAATDAACALPPAYYMINCAHPSHFEHVLRDGGEWRERIRGLRSNASRRSHAELDASTDLDAGDPIELAALHRRLQRWLPQLSVVGGCCGTDLRHVRAMGEALQLIRPPAACTHV